jgi:CTP:molybdopterin cytidylyltransferase MocA
VGTAGPVAGLVLAAGGSLRFGSPKQLALFQGRPLVEWPLVALADAGIEPRILVLGAEADMIEPRVELAGATIVRCPDWEEGQSASLRAGVRAIGDSDAEALVVVLGDEPLLSAEAVRRVVAARGDKPAVRATYSDTPVHPTLIERELWPQLLALRGDHGAAGVLGETGFTAVACDDLASPVDIDTPEDLKVLESSL